MIDDNSPFKLHVDVLRQSQERSKRIHVNFCRICHYVWKAPAAAANCVNCTNRKDGQVVSLVDYETEVGVM